MQIYADSLANLPLPADWVMENFQPYSRLEKFAHNRMLMRYLRYRKYPKQVRTATADIHHVTDHGYAHLIPSLTNGKCSITVHDLIPQLSYQGVIESPHGAKRRPWLNEFSLSFLSRFEKIVAPSKATARDITSQLGIDEQKITVIPPVIGAHFRPLAEHLVNAFASRNRLQQDARWLMISGQEFYKNHRVSLLVLAQLRRQGINARILKTGVATTEFNNLVEELGLADFVSQLYLADARELALVYNFVDCLLFPSLYEGFGMPVAESLACGTPVVASDRGALAEIAAGTIAHCDAHDVEQICHEVTAILGQQQQGYQHFSNAVLAYRPQQIAPQWVNFFNKLRSA